MYCNYSVQIPGASSLGEVPLFQSILLSNGQLYSIDSGIIISNRNGIENYLNSLNIGSFTVTQTGDGITISSLCNNYDPSEINYFIPSDPTNPLNTSFTESGCQELPCDDLCDEDCFEDLIGLRDVCTPPDLRSCLWLNDIGISKHTIEQYITKDYAGVTDFFNKQYSHTLREVVQTIHGHFNNKYLVNSILEGQRLGFSEGNLVAKISNSLYSGIYVKLLNTNSYIDFYLSELSLFTNHTGNITVKVFDVFEGRQIDTINVASIAGEQSRVSIQKTYKSKRKSMYLFFGYDNTGIDSYKTIIKPGLCCGRTWCSNEYIEAGGVYSPLGSFIDSGLTSENHTYGMSMVYSLQCNHKDWLCTHQNQINLSLLYKLAANISQFGLTASPNQRVNTNVTINRDQLISDLTHYQNEFIRTLESVLKNIQTPTDAKCFQCRENGRSVLVLP